MPRDPFAYREARSDAYFDFRDEQSKAEDEGELRCGRITREELERRCKYRRDNRERYKKEDHDFKDEVDMMYDSYSDSNFDEEVPPTPPRSPKRQSDGPDGPDLSEKAWKKDVKLYRLRWMYGSPSHQKIGFDDYETWKQYQIKYSRPRPSFSPAPPAPRNMPYMKYDCGPPQPWALPFSLATPPRESVSVTQTRTQWSERSLLYTPPADLIKCVTDKRQGHQAPSAVVDITFLRTGRRRPNPTRGVRNTSNPSCEEYQQSSPFAIPHTETAKATLRLQAWVTADRMCRQF